jgi:hypothetical protein
MRVKLWQSMECSVFEHPVVTVPARCGVLVACGHDRWMGQRNGATYMVPRGMW